MASIDDKVVSITFDNASFEKNVAQTMKTLAGLKASLDFKGAGAGLEDVAAASSKFSLAGMASAIEGISNKFSAMGAVAFSVINNITSRAVDAGLSLIKSFTLAPITDGFAEFELKMGSIQTIMSGSGESLEVVNGYLQELNEYSDKTIYSFKDMTSNIGKFTNAGLSLEDSVASIQGIANVAAISGANSEEASRAMYNFAQSLSSGSVKLMDWKSIENANMATAGFKTELLESAVAAGTLTKDAEGLYQTLEGTPVSATKGFNESLTEQWLTTEALNATLARYADETTEIGAAATAAATDVKTFSQMMDTLKEAAGSGWAVTSELIFGDFEEGKKLWTGINESVGGMLDASADARNSVLQIWKDGGGRALMIKSLGEAISSLGDILRPIKEAFREVFPAKTGRDLLTMTVRFSEFVKKLQPTEKTVERLKLVFLGVFSAIKIVIEVVKGVISVFTGLFSVFAGASGGGILLFFSKIGSGVNELRKALVDEGGIAKLFDKITDSLVALISKVNFGPTIKAIKEFVSSIDLGPVIDKITQLRDTFVKFFKGLDFSGPAEALGKFKDTIFGLFDRDLSIPKQVGESFSALGGVFSSLGGFIQSALDGIGNFGKGLGKAGTATGKVIGQIQNELANLTNEIKTSFSTGNFDNVLKALSVGMFGGLLVLIRKFLKDGLKLDFGQLGVFDELQKSLKAVTGGLTAMQNNIKADTLMKIAMALGVLTLSMLALSLVDGEDLAKALAAMTAGFIQLSAVMVVLEKLASGPTSAVKMAVLALGITAVAASMILLGLAAKLMSTMSWEEMARGLAGVTGLLLAMSGAVKLMSGNSAGMIQAGIGIGVIAASLLVLGLAVKLMATMGWEEMARGLIGVGGGLLIITQAMNKIDSNGVIKTAASIGVMGVSLMIMAGSIKVMASLGLMETAQGLLGIGAGLAIMVKVFNSIDNKKILQVGAAMLLASIGMGFMASAVKEMGSIPFMEMIKGLVGFSAVLIILALAMKSSKASLGGAAALFVVAQALGKLSEVLEYVGRLPFAVIIQGVLVMTGVLIGLAVLTNILSPLIPLMAGFGGALALVGVGAALFGAGVYLIARGVEILARAGSKGVEVFLSVIDDLLLKLPDIAAAFGAAALAFVTSFLAGFDELIPMVVGLIGQLLAAIKTLVPQLIQTAVVLITAFLNGIQEVYPKIVETGLSMILALLQGIRDNLGEIVTLVGEIIVEFITALSAAYVDIIAAGAKMIADVITGIAQASGDIIAAGAQAIIDFLSGVASNVVMVVDAGFKIVIDMLNGLADSIRKNRGELMKAGINILDAVFGGVISKAVEVMAWFVGLPLAVIGWIGSVVGTLAQTGRDFIKGMYEGILFRMEGVRIWFTGLAGNIKGYLWDAASWLIDTGRNIVIGLWEGIKDKGGWILGKINGFVQTYVMRPWNIIPGVNSPATELIKIGRFIVEGLGVGIYSKTGYISNIVSGMAHNVVEGFNVDEKELSTPIRNAVSAVANAVQGLDGLDEFNPTITPVLDLTNVYRDAKSLNGLFNDGVSTAYGRVSSIAASTRTRNESSAGETTSTPTEIKFEQNNYSPSALSTNDIYRKTRSQIALAKAELNIP